MTNFESSQKSESITKPKWEIGQTYQHLASDNRYQEFNILEIRFEPEAMFGLGCWIYKVEFYEYFDSNKKKLSQHFTREYPEVSLPITNLMPWKKRSTQS